MNSIDLLKLKNDTRCVLLNEMTITTILAFFNQSNIKTFKVVKKQVNILKNNRIQGKKDLNENKLILIMNKISQDNLKYATDRNMDLPYRKGYKFEKGKLIENYDY